MFKLRKFEAAHGGRRLLYLAVAVLSITVASSAIATANSGPTAHSSKAKAAKKKKKKKKQQGRQGIQGQQGTNGTNGTSGSPGTPATTHGTLTNVPDFTTSSGGPLFIHNAPNTTVKQTPDGIEFGPYADGGTAGGSIEYTGLNGQPLSAIQSLVYFMRYVASNDTAGIGSPYLRVFLGNDVHDLIFSPNSQTPNPDTAQGPFHTWVATSGTWRYDDDPGGTNPDLSFAAQKTAHGSETISGIYISVGFSAGTNLDALLREWQINATNYSFGL
jgi:hypothetical protein